jgi:hypothetical protein
VKMDVVNYFRQYYFDTVVRHTAQWNVDTRNHSGYLVIINEKEMKKFQGQNRASLKQSALRRYEKQIIMSCLIFIPNGLFHLEVESFFDKSMMGKCLHPNSLAQ